MKAPITKKEIPQYQSKQKQLKVTTQQKTSKTMGKTKTKVLNQESTEVKQHDIFAVVKHNNEIKICAGGHIISEKIFKTFTDAIKYIDSKPYELIVNVCALAVELKKKGEQQQ